MKRIVAIHLLNDRSGSPFVFRQALEVLKRAGCSITLYTATPSGDGFLSHMDGVEERALSYRHSANKWKTLFHFVLAQWSLFWRLPGELRTGDTVYVNTLLPMGAALAAKRKGCRVVYHIHEVSIRPAPLKWLLRAVARLTADEVISVSKYVEAHSGLSHLRSRVVYNALSPQFLNEAAAIPAPNIRPRFTVLMLCSLKAYKGVYSFIETAALLPDIHFELVLNASEGTVEAFCNQHNIPSNCRVFAAISNTIPFFQRAHVVVNLSHPDKWIETFGLTLLEAMACGRPVIAPNIGGPTELVTHGTEGYCVDGRSPELVASAIKSLRTDFRNYVRLSENARRQAANFSPDRFEAGIQEVFSLLPSPAAEPKSGNSFRKLEFSGRL